MTKSIYSLKLHEKLSLCDMWEILRVAGGWIYTCPKGQGHSVFVPYDNDLENPFYASPRNDK